MRNQFKPYLVCFLDILGFRNIISSKDTKKLELYKNIYSSLRDYWKRVDPKVGFKFFSFSDSLVICAPTKKNPRQIKDNLKHLCIVVASLQFHLAKNGIWLRGGLSFGDLSISRLRDDISAYGKPLIEAYDLENKTARFPRVLLHSNLVKQCGFQQYDQLIDFLNGGNNFSNWEGDLVFNWNHHTTDLDRNMFKQDYPMFIDYLEYLFHADSTPKCNTREPINRASNQRFLVEARNHLK